MGYTPKAHIHNDVSWDREALEKRSMLELDLYVTAIYALDQLRQAGCVLNEALANTFEIFLQSSLGE